ncbi:Crystallin, lambda 1 [Branchiostoma belcheri]|nr:Crystallin, lambda 1 [Branchiostoma belcheri]
MPFVCEICDQEFARKFNLDRHQERKHRDESVVASGEVVVDPETGCCRVRDVFDSDSDMSYEHDTDDDDEDDEDEEHDTDDDDEDGEHDTDDDDEDGEHDTDDDDEDEDSIMSQDDVSVSDEDESVVDSEEAESTTETDSEQSGSESDASSDVSCDPASSDDSEEYGYDSGDEEEWTLYRDWSILLPNEPGDVPQRVIKETKRAGRRFYLVEFAALPRARYSYNIEYTKNWVSEQTLMKKYGYVVLK